MNNIEKIYHDNGNIKEKCWYYNNKLHREDGPAIVTFNKDGKIIDETYFKNGLTHREDGPAVIDYHNNGNLKFEVYINLEYRHNPYGPARIIYDKDGKIEESDWFYRNQFYTRKVNKWIKENNFVSWEEMSESDFDRMWLEIL